MTPRSSVFVLLSLCACQGATSALPLGSADSPIRSPCDASPTAIAVLGGNCDVLPPSPLTGHPLFWSGERPCGAVVSRLDDEEEVHLRYDYAAAISGVAGGTSSFDDDGNLVRFQPELTTAAIVYQYLDGRYASARVEGDASHGELHLKSRYEGDRRVAEGEWQNDRFEPTYHWIYVDDRLVAEGASDASGNPPVPLARESLWLPAGAPPRRAPAGASAQRTYFYDDDGRLEAIGYTAGGRAPLLRVDLTYDADDRLTTATHGEAYGPSLPPRRIAYRYDCR